MGKFNKADTTILFLQPRNKLLVIDEDDEKEPQSLSLHRLLTDRQYVTKIAADPFTADQLEDIQVLVVVAARDDLAATDVEVIGRFLESGKGVLLVANSKTLINPLPNLNKLTGLADLEFHEYLNYPPTLLQVFRPHYITANVNRARVENVASLSLENGAFPLAFTRATCQPVIACATVESGRIIAAGDIDLFAPELLAVEDNKQLVVNMLHWLSNRNVVEIEEVIVPETVKWGQTASVRLKLRNVAAEARLQVKCILESDAAALISEKVQEKHSIPPGKTTRMQWDVRPKILGDQELRLSIDVAGQEPLYFDQLPEMRCMAPGYLTLEIKDKGDKLKTTYASL